MSPETENVQLINNNFDFVYEQFTNQCNFAFLNDIEYSIDIDNNISAYSADFSTYPACTTVKNKFRFPRDDPAESVILDQRSGDQKIRDILRVWSQVLNPDEAKIWSSCAQRDISHDITLKNGIRTPKVIVDEAIKRYKIATLKEKTDLLKGQLSHLPDQLMTPSETYVPTNEPLTDSTCILPEELVIDEAMIAKVSVPDPADKFAQKLSLSGQACVQPTTEKLSPRNLPDTVNLQSTQPRYIAKLLIDSQQEIIKIRRNQPQKLVYIFKK